MNSLPHQVLSLPSRTPLMGIPRADARVAREARVARVAREAREARARIVAGAVKVHGIVDSPQWMGHGMVYAYATV